MQARLAAKPVDRSRRRDCGKVETVRGFPLFHNPRCSPSRNSLTKQTVASLALRVCDFFDFTQIAVLKTNSLRAKKSSIFKKVTNSQDDLHKTGPRTSDGATS